MRFFVFIALLLSGSVSAQDVYVEVDENGVPTFSDQKLPGGEKVELREPMIYSDPRAQEYARQRNVEKLSPDSGKRDYSLLITNPPNDTAVRENAGNLTVTVEITPRLLDGDIAELMMDGTPVRKVTGSGPVSLTSLDRGTHVFSVRVSNSDGKVVAEGPGSSITILRQSILRRNN